PLAASSQSWSKHSTSPETTFPRSSPKTSTSVLAPLSSVLVLIVPSSARRLPMDTLVLQGAPGRKWFPSNQSCSKKETGRVARPVFLYPPHLRNDCHVIAHAINECDIGSGIAWCREQSVDHIGEVANAMKVSIDTGCVLWRNVVSITCSKY